MSSPNPSTPTKGRDYAQGEAQAPTPSCAPKTGTYTRDDVELNSRPTQEEIAWTIHSESPVPMYIQEAIPCLVKAMTLTLRSTKRRHGNSIGEFGTYSDGLTTDIMEKTVALWRELTAFCVHELENRVRLECSRDGTDEL